MATMVLGALMTAAHAPNAEEGAVIGQGTGMSSHILLANPHLKRLATIEIEPEMIKASRAFLPANRRVFEDPRSIFIIDDAKSYFAAAGRQYDFIFSEPSNPWVSGVSGLFTAEFYDRVTQYLKPNGVFAQWIHLYDLNDRLVTTVLAALHEKFRDYQVFMPVGSDMIVIATNAPKLPNPDWSVFQWPGIQQDLCHQLPFTPEAMEPPASAAAFGSAGRGCATGQFGLLPAPGQRRRAYAVPGESCRRPLGPVQRAHGPHGSVRGTADRPGVFHQRAGVGCSPHVQPRAGSRVAGPAVLRHDGYDPR
jgi:hypothetical protein